MSELLSFVGVAPKLFQTLLDAFSSLRQLCDWWQLQFTEIISK